LFILAHFLPLLSFFFLFLELLFQHLILLGERDEYESRTIRGREEGGDKKEGIRRRG
jgi:hypothetical protein